MISRKLQNDVDRTIKRVSEGISDVDELFQKIHTAISPNQKEKLENDLKREIKKLQKLRDQIKGWISGNEIKNKDIIVDARKRIELKMERFKDYERRSKMKAYSKEGLSRPSERDRDKSRDIFEWIKDRIASLNRQIEKLESELDGLDLKHRRLSFVKLDRHNFHLMHLEKLLRKWDNESIDRHAIELIKDDVNYYVDQNRDDDFQEDEGIYEELGLDDLHQIPPTVIIIDSSDTPKPNHKIEPLHLEPINNDSSELPTKVSSSTKAPTEEWAETNKNRTVTKTTKRRDDQENISSSSSYQHLSFSDSKIDPSLIDPSTDSVTKEDPYIFPSAFQTPPSKSNPSSSISARSSPARFRQSSTRRYVSNYDHPQLEIDFTSQPNLNPPIHTHIHPQSEGQEKKKILIPSNSPSQTIPFPSIPIHPSAHPNIHPQSHQHPHQHPQSHYHQVGVMRPFSPTQNENGSQINQAIFYSPNIENQNWINSQSPHITPGRPIPHPTGIPITSPIQSHQSIEPRAGEGYNQRGIEPRMTKIAPIHPNLITNFNKIHSNLIPSHLQPQLQLQSHPNFIPFNHSTFGHGYQEEINTLLINQSLKNIPQPISSMDSIWPSKSTNHPMLPMTSLLENGSIFEKLSTDTLFYIFYYQQNTYRQYLAAKELKRQSWRYHTKYLTWFQRLEEPKSIGEDYEQGTYIYFDYETGWCQRKKSEFTFRYAFLEGANPIRNERSQNTLASRTEGSVHRQE